MFNGVIYCTLLLYQTVYVRDVTSGLKSGKLSFLKQKQKKKNDLAVGKISVFLYVCRNVNCHTSRRTL